MAVYTVGKDGNAPKGTTTGDYVVTAGGTYEVLDSNKYKGMSPDQLKQSGVGFNPATGLYSRKVNSITSTSAPSSGVDAYSLTPSGRMSSTPSSKSFSYTKETIDEPYLLNYSTADKWLKNANEQATNKLASNYITNVSNAEQSYRSNLGAYKTQLGAINDDYNDSLANSNEQAYQDGLAMAQRNARTGMLNSAQGAAMSNSNLFAASERKTDLAQNRIRLQNNVFDAINTLTQNYNVSLDELERSRLANEISMMNDNQLEYLAKVMDIDAYNADVMNDLNNSRIQMEFQANEAQKQRDWQDANTERERQFALEQMKYNNSYGGNSYGGSYYRGGNSYYGGGSGKGGSGNDSDNPNGSYSDDELSKILFSIDSFKHINGRDLTPEEEDALRTMYEGILAGFYTPDDFYEYYKGLLGGNGTPRNVPMNPGISFFDTMKLMGSDGVNVGSVRGSNIFDMTYPSGTGIFDKLFPNYSPQDNLSTLLTNYRFDDGAVQQRKSIASDSLLYQNYKNNLTARPPLEKYETGEFNRKQRSESSLLDSPLYNTRKENSPLYKTYL